MTSPEKPTETDGLRTWAEIDLSALAANARTCAAIAGQACRLLAVVKADGYGHGIREVAEALAPLPEVWGFGVANVAEAEAIADAIVPGQGILVLGPLLPSEREAAVTSGFSVPLSTTAEAAAFAALAGRHDTTVSVHVTIDTGMGRMGALPGEARNLVDLVRAAPELQLDGIATHFPSADEDAKFTLDQIDAFHHLIEDNEAASGPDAPLLHAANSAGLLAFSPQLGFARLARPGLALYGISPVAEHADELRPVLSLKSRITLVRELPAGHGVSYGRSFVTDHPTAVASIGIGYGDGYPRHLSGRQAEVIIAGERCQLLGRVTMDQIMADVSALDPLPQPGDEVVLIGEGLGAAELAEKSGTIPWEILTGISKRVVRVYT